ncbi:MAG: endonuclease/exonuclease/phosphatase family protein [Patescibacteria group bacterium]
MQLVSLNTWTGKVFKDLIRFVETSKGKTDIFCFQEIFHTNSDVRETHGSRANLYEELSAVLSGFTARFDSYFDNHDLEDQVNFPLSFGVATFIKQGIEVKERGTSEIITPDIISKAYRKYHRLLQYSKISRDGITYLVANLHGIYIKGSEKRDTPERLVQSAQILKFLAKHKDKKIVCGDFNLLPETESIHMLEQNMDNLIKRFNITTTRSHLYPKNIPWADYTFVSHDVSVEEFSVPSVPVSDHLPMVLKFQ